MKQTIVSLIIILSSISLFGQRAWDPFDPNLTYNISRWQTNQLDPYKVDSIEISGSDTIFYFNTVITSCDSLNSSDYLCNDGAKMFQRKCIIRDSLWIFCDPDTFYYKPYARPGDTWVIDSNSMKTAVVEQIILDTVFGVYDSLKYIKIGTWDWTILSKHHGFARYYHVLDDDDYELIGIPELQLGRRAINFDDAYNFQSIDVLIYRQKAFRSNVESFKRIFSKEIIHRVISGDTFTYEIKETMVHIDLYNIPFDTIRYQQTYTEKYINSPGHPLNYRTREFAPSVHPPGFWQRLYKTENSASLGHAGYSAYNYQNGVFIRDYDFIPWVEWKTGLGAVDIGYTCADSASRVELVGWVINGDTIKYPYPEIELLGITDDTGSTFEYRLFPNPCKGELKLETFNTKNINFSLYNSFGQLVYMMHDITTNNTIIDLSNFPAGSYYYRLISDDKNIRNGKLILL